MSQTAVSLVFTLRLIYVDLHCDFICIRVTVGCQQVSYKSTGEEYILSFKQLQSADLSRWSCAVASTVN